MREISKPPIQGYCGLEERVLDDVAGVSREFMPALPSDMCAPLYIRRSEDGRRSPSAFSLETSVVGLMPSSFAAPSGP
jgi:hypothetical protein